MNKFLLLVLLLSSSAPVEAQSLSIAPNAGTTGQTLDVVIKGTGTNFTQGITKVEFVSPSDLSSHPITVLNLIVSNKEMMIATVKVTSNNSKIGWYDVIVTTASNVVSAPKAFEIFYSFSKLRGVLEVMPVQSINLADFDPTNFAASPNLFFVTIYNDDKVRDINIDVEMFTQSGGQVGVMKLTLTGVPENSVTRKTNKDFPRLDMSGNGGLDLITRIRQTGSFPADNYSFKLKVTDPNTGSELAFSEVTILISNPNYKPELISPGNTFNRPPEMVINGYPVFQWFGQADRFDFYLYKVNEGQSPEEAVRNIPEFKKIDNVGNILPYPVYAEQLIDGTTYAWQVVAKVGNTKSVQFYQSEVFWFLHDAPESISHESVEEEKTITHVKIEPSDMTINAGGSFQFSVVGYDANNMPVEISEMDWKVTPREGTVDSSGLFVAGAKPGTMAVIVKINDVEDFATITVKPAAIKSDEQMIDKIMKDLFGLPKKKD